MDTTIGLKHMTSRVFAFHCGGVRSFRGFYDATDENALEVVYEPAYFFLLEFEGRYLLFDTGMSPRLKRDDDGSLGVLLSDENTLVPLLAKVGVTPAKVEGVVLSHLHLDHSGGLEHIAPDTPVYVNSRELDFARNPPAYQRPFFDQEDLQFDTNWVEVEGELDILGDGRLTIIPTPGHTPGHQVLKVHLENRTIVLCGDASYVTGKMRERRVPGVVWNPDLLVQSWELLERVERTESALLVFAHDLDSLETKPRPPLEWYS